MLNKNSTLGEFLDICFGLAKMGGEKEPQITTITAIARELITSVVYSFLIENNKDKLQEEEEKPEEIKETKEEKQENKPKKKPTWDEWRKFWGKVNKLKLTNNDVHRLLGVESVRDLVDELTLDEIYQILEAKVKEGKF